MFRLTTVLFVMLILVALLVESEVSVEVSAVGPRCDDYWAPFGGELQCRTWNTGATHPSGVSPPAASVSSPRGTPAPGKTSVDPQRQEMGESAVSGSAAERTSQRAPGSQEVSPTVTVQPNDAAVGSRSEGQVLKPLSRSPISGGAAPSPPDSVEQHVDKTVHEQEVDTVGGQQSMEAHSRKRVNEGNAISRKELTGPDNGSVAQPPARRAVLGAEQENTEELATSNMNEQESKENNTQVRKSTAHKMHVVILSTALSLVCL
ncbi:expression site-associated gene 9 (ESAG9) protein, putative [Trypanosoma equiperdum]|uniref:Expression site-associated gene 9 (ESAG9) protein, putative n=2 Tax=Trypanozoon TaxID=39700 RepID=Q38EK5_TRYB2|nr:expression site-associated protein [Trypanosoma brucei brucei TREU927]EAN76765.1 expression site-associated gene 9 (ESAG9) protein, putative [Trypanosoma brucei brucei TREU927]SCU64404.1 expression site-associated gene 9 (ESAG9) protein, putative [Trypanosoma equiperdum]